MLNANALQFFTIVARNYLAYAFVLGKSVLRHHPDAAFSIFLMDDPEHRWQSSIEAQGFGPIYPEEIPLQDYQRFVFQYNITEACTGVKPSVVATLFDKGAEKVIYLDPDILCFRRFDEVLAALDRYCVVLTPHICSAAPDDYYPGERALMSTGVFNLGFIALRKSETARQLINWWSQHLRYECLEESETGLFVDQKWVDLVPAFFDDVYIMRSPAYNIAYWNLRERILQERDVGLCEARSGEVVAFMHFSGFPLEDLNSIHKYGLGNPFAISLHKKRFTLTTRPDLVGPVHMYKELLEAADIRNFSKIPYGYATYDNGEPISQLERSLYLSSPLWLKSNADPFQTGPGSFRNACRQAGLRSRAVTTAKSLAQETIRKYSPYMRIVEFILRCCLRVMGPQRYLEFAKYMRHQFLPQNHGFLLRGKAIDGPEDLPVAESKDRRGSGKALCETLKP